MTSALIGRVTRQEFAAAPDLIRAAAEWLRSLGLTPEDLALQVEVRMDPVTGRAELHVVEHLRNAAGKKYVDHTGDVAQRPRVVPLLSWPEWLAGMGVTGLQTV
jgi:hypothetical protein